jgi:hypothetical protein
MKATCCVLTATNPAHAPHEKNGEQPGHSFSFDWAGWFFSVDVASLQSSAQHGFTVNSNTISVNIKQKNFTKQM